MIRMPASLVVLALALLVAPCASAQLLSQQDQTVTAADGTTFVLTSAVVRVQAIRLEPAAGSIDLAVVRARRVGAAPGASAHVMLAGGPGDSGVDLVLGMVKLARVWHAPRRDENVEALDRSPRASPRTSRIPSGPDRMKRLATHSTWWHNGPTADRPIERARDKRLPT